jgi:aspartokinase-like uncharacterized kinase
MNATVVKVGGSIAKYPEKLRALCIKLSETSKRHRLIVVPGGGEFADVVRSMDKRFSLSYSTAHNMAILGMDQYGMLLTDLIPNATAVRKLEEINYYLDSSRLPVLLPSNLLLKDTTLENSWDVTSDAITLFIAVQLNIGKVMLVTDVDGIYSEDPKKNSNAKFKKQLSANELLAMNKRTSVDSHLSKLLMKVSIECFVLNGLFPDRVEAVLEGRKSIFTLIKNSVS